MNKIKSTLKFLIFLTIISCSKNKKQIVEEESQNQVESAENEIETQKVFTWTTELCTIEGNYDSKKYTEAELKATYELWWKTQGYLNLDVTPSKDEDISQLSIEKLDREYNEKLRLFKSLKIVNEPYWLELKKNKIRELDESYELKVIAIKSYSHPEVLMENRFTEQCRDYAEALSSMDDELLLATWKKLVEKQMAANGSPERVLAKYNSENASENRLKIARRELMTYGWWNCANHVIYHFEDDGTPQKEFEKLFSNVKSQCDEP